METGIIVAKKAVEFLAEEVISSLIQNKMQSNSLDNKVEKALANALNQVAKGNDFWKSSVQIRKKEVLSILVQVLSDSNDLEKLNESNYPLPSYLDKETIKRFNEQLEKDAETYLYLKVLVHDKILKDLNYQSIHCLTNPPAYPHIVIGRDNDLQTLWKALNDKKHIMLTGFGGIGKTKLAQLLFHKYKGEFDEVAWINYSGNLKKSFLSSIIAEKFQSSAFKDEDERWNAMKSKLISDGKKKLFIIDNVDNDAEICQYPIQDEELDSLTGWDQTTILLTSRLERNLENFETITLDVLEEDKCVEVFIQYYEGKVQNQEIVTNIVRLANRHTLTIELLAKGAGVENLEEYYNKLVDCGFDKVDRDDIFTKHHKGITTIEKHLKVLFDMQPRSDTDKKILYSFAILPVNCECSISEIGDWFGFKNSDLDALRHDGWLSYNEDKQTFNIHSLVRTIVRFDFNPDEHNMKTIAPQGVVEPLLDYLGNHQAIFHINSAYNRNLGFISIQRMIGLTESAISVAAQKDTVQIATLYEYMGISLSVFLGDYEKSLMYLIKSKELRKSKLGKNHPDLAESYSQMAIVYRLKGDYDKAWRYLNKSMKIIETEFGKNHPEMAKVYNDMALVFNGMHEFEKALEYHKKAQKIRESELGKNHPEDLAATYHNMGVVYIDLGDYNKAIEYLEKSNEILEKLNEIIKKSNEMKEIKLSKNRLEIAANYGEIGLVYARLNNNEKALEYYEKELEIENSELGKDNPNSAGTYTNMAFVYEAKENYDKALECYEKAMEIRESKLGKGHPLLVTTYDNIGWVYSEIKGDKDKALEYYKKALEIVDSKLSKDHPDTAITYNNIAEVYRAKGEYDKAVEYYMVALKILLHGVPALDAQILFFTMLNCYEKTNRKISSHQWTDEQLDEEEKEVLQMLSYQWMNQLNLNEELLKLENSSAIEESRADEDLQKIQKYTNIGIQYKDEGNYNQALEYCKKALKIVDSKMLNNHQIVATIYNCIADVYSEKQEYDKALEYYFKVLKIDESTFGNDHPNTAISFNNIAEVYRNKQDYDKALEYNLKALEIKESKLGKEHLSTATTYNNIAEVYKAKDDYDKALKYQKKALRIKETELGQNHPSTAASYNNLACTYMDMGINDKALKYFQKALMIIESNLGKDHPKVATTYNNMALLYADMDNDDKALEYFQKALAIFESVLGKSHPLTNETYKSIVYIHNKIKAKKVRENILEIEEPKSGKNRIDTVEICCNNLALGGVYKAQGEYYIALEYYEKALQIGESKLGKGHHITAEIYRSMALLYRDMDDYDKALIYYVKTLKAYLIRPDVNAAQGILFGLKKTYDETKKVEPFGNWLKKQLNNKEWKYLK